MPDATDNLTVQASKQQRDEAVSSCVAQLIGEGRDQDQAVAICMDKADKATGNRTPR